VCRHTWFSDATVNCVGFSTPKIEKALWFAENDCKRIRVAYLLETFLLQVQHPLQCGRHWQTTSFRQQCCKRSCCRSF